MSESALKREVATALDSAGVLYVRINSGGYRGRMRGAPKGTPDFVGWMNPDWYGTHSFAIETKASHSDSCKCSSCSAQRTWRKEFEKRGGLYILARKLQDVLDQALVRK